MTKIGYARVSTIDQDFEIQQQRLRAEGCVIVRAEKVSGASRVGRTKLATIIEFLREGDELVVTRLDRLGRDTRDVLNIVHECEQRGAFVTILDPHVSTRGELGHMVLTWCWVWSLRWSVDLSKSGNGKASSGPNQPGATPEAGFELTTRNPKSLRIGRGLGVTAIAKEIGCSRMQVYRVLSS